MDDSGCRRLRFSDMSADEQLQGESFWALAFSGSAEPMLRYPLSRMGMVGVQ